jgi:hypothetical protein
VTSWADQCPDLTSALGHTCRRTYCRAWTGPGSRTGHAPTWPSSRWGCWRWRCASRTTRSCRAFTDERNDIAQALRIVRGEGLPLTNDPSYIGAFWAGGESLLVPRTVVLILGVVGVLAAYPPGRAWGGRCGGLLATMLLATSTGHIAFTSRVAWSHSITPLFVTLGVWALIGAVRRTTPRAGSQLGPRRRLLGVGVPDAPDDAGAPDRTTRPVAGGSRW